MNTEDNKDMQLEKVRKLLEWDYTEKHDYLVRKAMRFTGDEQLAWEVVHESYIRALEKADEFLNSPKPIGWLVKTIYFVALDEMDRAYHTEVQIPDLGVLNSMRAKDPDEEPLDHILPKNMRDRDKELLCLRIEQEWSYEQLSEQFGMKQEACRKRVSRLLKSLAETLYPEQAKKPKKRKKMSQNSDHNK